MSLGARFRLQLNDLMSILERMEPYYVRCIKPNDTLKSQEYDTPKVIEQLKCNGVMEAIRISLEGYSAKRPYGDFLTHFGVINMPEYFKLIGNKASSYAENIQAFKNLTRDVIKRADVPDEAY